MQLWEKILQLALLGSERSHLEPAVKEALRQYRIDPEDPLPQVVLSGAAAIHQVRRLQLPVSSWKDALPDRSRDETDTKELSPLSLQHLNQILSGRFRQALPEYVQFLLQQRLLLPPEFLPDLLDNCLQDAELWREIQPLLGNRAEWLISQHPEWRVLQPRGDYQRWAGAGHEERLLIFGYERALHPDRAMNLLEAVWEDIDYRKKQAYLEIMERDLRPDDEEFLERARLDSRKEIRLKAADLLASLPDSQLIRRIFAELTPLFTFQAAKQRLEVTLPKDIPTATAKDGIQAGVKKGKRGGLKVDWLFECVSRIPAGLWMEHFQWELDELIRYFDTTNRADLLLSALGKASLRFRDMKLGNRVINYLLIKNGAIPGEMDWKALVRQIPTADFQQMLTDFFSRQPGLLDEKHLATKMLELGRHPWNETISRQLINGLKQWMSESKTFLWNLWHYKRLLEVAGYGMPVHMLDELAADWPMHSPVWNQWAPDVERMFRTLRFRKEMKETLIR